MNDDEIDGLMRRHAARYEVSSARADRVIASVLDRLPDARLAHRPRRSLAAWCLALLEPAASLIVPVGRLAVPIAAAAVLGVIVGRDLDAAQTPVRFAEILTTSSVDMTGL
jgi:hypothetical protein